MSNKGAVFERLCRKELEECGWLAIKSSDSSRADIIALRNENGVVRALAVECKGGRKLCGPEQWNDHYSLSMRYGLVPVLADKVPGKSAPRWWLMTGEKSGRREPQPRVPFSIEGWASDGV